MRSAGSKQRDRILSEAEIIGAIARLKSSRQNKLPQDDIGFFHAQGTVFAATDSLIEGIHYRNSWLSAADIAYKLFARNYSDFAVKGVRPQNALLNLALRREHAAVSFLRPFLKELDRLFNRHSITLIGGDTSSSPNDHFTLTFIGAGRTFVARKAARLSEGDLVMQCGRIGGSDAARALLESSAIYAKANVSAFRRPRYLEEPIGKPAVAAIDQSDSVQKTLQLLAEANGAHLEIELEAVKTAAALGRLTAKNAHQVLGAAEDLAVFCIFPRGGIVQGKSAPAFRPVGTVKYIQVRRPQVSYTLHGKPYNHHAVTFEHFA